MQEASNYNDYLIYLIEEHSNKKQLILDFGAGIGTYAKTLKKNGYKIVCLEPDTNQCKVIESNDIEVYKSLEDIEDNSLDFIYSLNVLEHIEDDLLIIKKLKDKLKQDGELFLYLPAFELLYSSMDKKVGHFRRYNFKMLESLAKNADLKVYKKSYVDSLGFFITLLYKVIGNKEGNIDKKSLIIYDRVIFPISKLFDKVFNQFFGKNVYMVFKK